MLAVIAPNLNTTASTAQNERIWGSSETNVEENLGLMYLYTLLPRGTEVQVEHNPP